MSGCAIITGAGSGIGFGCAEKLSARGVPILGVGRNKQRLCELKERVSKPELVRTLAIDITDKEAPGEIVATARKTWGSVSVLINNAGVGSPRPLHETDDELLDLNLDLMLRAPFRLVREALPYMKPEGVIINISSTFGVVGGLRGGAYSVAKAGITGLTQHIACQYGAQGIRCNAVAPGVIPTAMTEGMYDNKKFQKMNVEMTPHTRLGTVDDVASTVDFLCSSGGSFINGQVILVDGGWSTTKYLSDFGLKSDWTLSENTD